MSTITRLCWMISCVNLAPGMRTYLSSICIWPFGLSKYKDLDTWKVKQMFRQVDNFNSWQAVWVHVLLRMVLSVYIHTYIHVYIHTRIKQFQDHETEQCINQMNEFQKAAKTSAVVLKKQDGRKNKLTVPSLKQKLRESGKWHQKQSHNLQCSFMHGSLS